MSKGSKKQTETTSQSSGTSMPVIPESWRTAYDSFLSDSQSRSAARGLNDSQIKARDYFSGNLNPTQFTLKPADRITPRDVTSSDVTTQQWDAQRTEAMGPYGTSDVEYEGFSANKGSEFLNDYMNPYTKDVVDTSLADFDAGTDRALAAAQARRGAGSAFGTGADVSDALFSADAARGRGSLSAGLRSNAFNTAAGLGMADADRFTNAAATNAAGKFGAATFNAGASNAAARDAFSTEAARRNSEAARIDASRADNARNFLTASTGNADRSVGVATGNANRGLSADTTNAANAITVDQGNADLFNANRGFGLNNAGALAAMGQTEFGQGNQNWENLLRALQLGTAQFGNTSTTNSSGNTTETKTPGLFDWLSLGVSAINPLKKAFG